MTNYRILFSKEAEKDIVKIKKAGLENKTTKLLSIMAIDPFFYPPSYEKLKGNLTGKYSRRINIQHRIVYSVNEDEKIIYVYRLWTHYEN